MKHKFTLLLLAALSGFFQVTAQVTVSEFDDLLLPMPPMGSYWNGVDQSGGFVSGGMYFNNDYDTSFGGYWAGGFAYSSMVDSVTSGFTNLYAAKAASGFGGSSNYAVVQQNAIARLNNPVTTMVINGFYVTNGTYAYNSMKNGDTFARKFGDTTGTNSTYPQGSYPDFFKLTVKAFVGGILSSDSVEFYLADYRFSNDSLDYIVKTWEWVDCSILGVFDSLQFHLSSSDNSSFGMNTPAFFCIDNLTIDVTVGAKEMAGLTDKPITYPNPVSDKIYFSNSIDSDSFTVEIRGLNGQFLRTELKLIATDNIDVSDLAPGIYFLKLSNNKTVYYQKFTKL